MKDATIEDSMTEDRGQVVRSAAEVYDAFFVPALFDEWAPRMANAGRLKPGQEVLDVACGTGVLARTAAARGAAVIGLDINEAMLAVAARKAPHIKWRQGRAESLPFEDNRFDVVLSQFGLMFFEDRITALREMVRVLRPGGRLVVAVWDSLASTPGYAAMVALLQQLFGEDVANGLKAPFVLGNTAALRALFASAGITQTDVTTQVGTARFPSLRAWIYTEIRGWVLADALDDAQFARLSEEAEHVLAPFVTADGRIAFDAPAHIVTAVKV